MRIWKSNVESVCHQRQRRQEQRWAAIKAFSFSSACSSWNSNAEKQQEEEEAKWHKGSTAKANSEHYQRVHSFYCFSFSILFLLRWDLPTCTSSSSDEMCHESDGPFAIQVYDILHLVEQRIFAEFRENRVVLRASVRRTSTRNLFSFSFEIDQKQFKLKSDPFNVNAARIHWLLSFDMQFRMWCMFAAEILRRRSFVFGVRRLPRVSKWTTQIHETRVQSTHGGAMHILHINFSSLHWKWAIFTVYHLLRASHCTKQETVAPSAWTCKSK